jgi:hypothetical protein
MADVEPGIIMQHQHFLCPFVFALLLDYPTKMCEDAAVNVIHLSSVIFSETCHTIASVWVVAGWPGLTLFSTFLIPLLKATTHWKTVLQPGAALPETALG